MGKGDGSKSDCNNYRGISLLAIADKILEKVRLKRLTSTIIDPILPESKCGFRANRGATEMIKAEENSKKQHKDLCKVFINLTNA